MLNTNKIDYLLYHLNYQFEISTELKKLFLFGDNDASQLPYIFFPLSERQIEEIKYINEIPILFPLSDRKTFYKLDVRGNLIFFDDLLKSAFYLLSGYQETLPYTPDKNGRFSYDNSIQKKLGITHEPLVNIYFERIKEGIKEFCSRHGIPFKERNLWDGHDFAVSVTHDVDRVDKYHWPEIKLRAKRMLGLTKDGQGFFTNIKYLGEASVKWLKGENSYWNFELIKQIEDEFGINSAWYFLPKRKKNIDAYYSFSEGRIKKLVDYLQETGDEIGLHPTYESMISEDIMRDDLRQFEMFGMKLPAGCRQHWLRFKYPDTLRIQEKLGFKYDTSWGFHDHTGWRNSYCLPFRPYDIEQDRMMDIWELPLSVMDKSLVQYQHLQDNESVIRLVDRIYQSAKLYRGICIVLWHNSFFEPVYRLNPKIIYSLILKRAEGLNAYINVPGKLLSSFENI